eukprot:jgi/Psemu1/305101/fgenesh1_kg.182_\
MTVENEKETTIEPTTTVASCPNPDCIRCRRYRYVQERAERKITWILRDLKASDPSAFSKLNQRIPNTILRPETLLSIGNGNGNGNGSGRNGSFDQLSSLQNPTVLMVSDLLSREIVTDWHRDACIYLKKRRTRAIVLEALQEIAHSDCVAGASLDDIDWTVNDSSPDGEWKVFHILNQGVWNPILLSANNEGKKSCQKLLELVRGIPGLLNNCLFGNIFVSKIYPGTNIEPHCGPTNVRHRLQFLLKLPETLMSSTSPVSDRNDNCRFECNETPTLSLSVGLKEEIFWDMNSDTFVFDDSFVHSVTYRDQEEKLVDQTVAYVEDKSESKDVRTRKDLARTVLIVDLWHPNLQEMEKIILQQAYPPFIAAV